MATLLDARLGVVKVAVISGRDMKPGRRASGTTRKLFALSLAIALATSGVGIILPVVPSHLERLGLASASIAQVQLHVSLLAAG